MIRNNLAQTILRSAALSAGLLVTTVPAAMAQAASARAQYACAVIMGLNQSKDLYDACVESLDRSLSAAQPQGNEATACSYVGLSSTSTCPSNLRETLRSEEDSRWNQDNIAAR